MIPKRIFFIWIGDNIPNYVNFSMEKFKEVNPNFEIIFKNHKIDSEEPEFKYCVDIFITCLNRDFRVSKNDDEIYKSMSSIFSNGPVNIFRRLGRKEKYTIKDIDSSLYAMISDGYRFYLLYKYGGIYIDCDTFPIRPFDDNLLNYDEIRCKSDIYFLGTKENNKFRFNYKNPNVKMIPQSYQWNNTDKTNFYNCSLNYKEQNLLYSKFNEYYFHHFQNRSWIIKK